MAEDKRQRKASNVHIREEMAKAAFQNDLRARLRLQRLTLTCHTECEIFCEIFSYPSPHVHMFQIYSPQSFHSGRPHPAKSKKQSCQLICQPSHKNG
jgi:hypothetical protein